jgi:Protein of unknown function (DUF4197)
MTKHSKSTLFAIIFAGLFVSGCAAQKSGTLGQILDRAGEIINPNKPLSTDEIAQGLREALRVGIDSSARRASMIDGYFAHPTIKLLFPPDVQKVEARLRQVGLGNEVDKFVLSLNRAAEGAAKKAKPLFWTAIKQMSISDALSILKGDKNAATQYFRRTMYDGLYKEFSPVVDSTLSLNNTTKYYADLVNTYNKIPLVQKVNPDLKKYATDKAIDGLFYLVEQEERKIRENPMARVTDILKRVFGSNQ